MQMGYDFNQALPLDDSAARAVGARLLGQPGPGAAAESSGLVHPEWASLRARFQALHALRQAVPVAAAASLPAGGFAASGESVLSSCRTGEAVNPVYWANLKEDSGHTSPVAASPTRGDRGMA